jgi:GNAT superfamily N-acetyltransferase
MLQFVPLSKYKSGLLFQLLLKCYKEFSYKDKYLNDWKQFDKEAFSNPKIGQCVFITNLDDKPIGFVSYDPRNFPEYAIIGHNCILPMYQGKGYGKMQIEELLGRFKKLHFIRVQVTTGEHSFFSSAQQMYLNCGFKEIKRFIGDKQDIPKIQYEKDL